MIRVLLFASLREAYGEGEVSLSLPGQAKSVSAGEVFDQLSRQAPELESFRGRVGIAVNHRFGTMESGVSEGDEVAFYPPVSGGLQ